MNEILNDYDEEGDIVIVISCLTNNFLSLIVKKKLIIFESIENALKDKKLSFF